MTSQESCRQLVFASGLESHFSALHKQKAKSRAEWPLTWTWDMWWQQRRFWECCMDIRVDDLAWNKTRGNPTIQGSHGCRRGQGPHNWYNPDWVHSMALLFPPYLFRCRNSCGICVTGGGVPVVATRMPSYLVHLDHLRDLFWLISVAPKLRNRLPRDPHLSSSVAVFCQRVKTILFCLAFTQ